MSIFGDAALPERFWVKVSRVPSGCWIWTAATTNGYGKFKYGARIRSAHRVAYETLIGPVPITMHIDHLCRNRACVNPEHLEPVTCRENILRGISPSAQHAMKTHCPADHEYTELNTYLYRGMRMCRACRAEQRAGRDKGRAAQELKSDPADHRHGTLTGYMNYACRCDLCRTANREYKREYRARTG